MSERFVLVRLGNMRGLDLNVFDFDYDLTWAALFLSADGRAYGRYGSRDDDGKPRQSLTGLRFALANALAAHERMPAAKVEAKKPRRIEEYVAAKRFSANACLHCHHVYDFRREEMQAKGTWTTDEVWVHPRMETLGLAFDPLNETRAVKGPGLRAGDVIQSLAGRSVASRADMRYALHHFSGVGPIDVVLERSGNTMTTRLDLPTDWRKTDISWRWSLKGLKPESCVHGDDLTPAEKRALGLDPDQTAFRQGPFVHPKARQAGIQINDVILGVEGKTSRLSARQFDAHIRLNYKPGDEVGYYILRGKERLVISFKLPG